MPRKPSRSFTDKELEIMRIFWKAGEASARQIQEKLPGSPHYNSVMTIIRVLERKGHLTHREDGRTYVYKPTVSHSKARKKVLGHLLKQVFDGSAPSLVLNLVDSGDLTIEDLDEIRSQISAVTKRRP